MLVRTGAAVSAALSAAAASAPGDEPARSDPDGGRGPVGPLKSPSAQVPALSDPEPFGYCLNTSTIRGQQLSLVEEIEITARAGYRGIEPWIREIDQYVAGGGTLADLAKRIKDLGLSVESVIGFCEWIVDDDARRRKGMEEARRCMELTLAIGGKRLAAPPAGATDVVGLDLRVAARRYRELLLLGEKIGVVPQLELWGFSKTLSRLSEAAYVAIESGHAQACILPDVYHLYKGGSDFSGLKLLSGSAIHVFHMNDYPSTPARAEITDAQRVFPGDGVAPLVEIFRDLRAIGFRGMLSLELFNRDYWQQDAFAVAQKGLVKMRDLVKRSASQSS